MSKFYDPELESGDILHDQTQGGTQGNPHSDSASDDDIFDTETVPNRNMIPVGARGLYYIEDEDTITLKMGEQE